MPTPFDTLNLTTAKAKVAAPAGYTESRAFYDGDHWQSGAGWVGPRPDPSESGAAEALRAIQAGFLSSNVIHEVVDRHVGGVVGKEPAWRVTVARALGDGEAPTPEEQARIDEAEALLTAWWDARGAHDLLQEATATLLLAGRAPLRLFVPPRYVRDDGSLEPGALGDWMARLYPQSIDPAQAAVVTDADTQEQAAIYAYTKDGAPRVELTYRDGADTVVRLFAGESVTEARQDFGGRLPIYELRRPALITTQVRQLQRALNKSLSMMAHNEDLAGFTERTLLNAQLPGTYETDPTTGQRRFKPDPYRVGPGATNVIIGESYVDEDNKTKILNPSIVFRDPASPATFISSQSEYYARILRETHQMHALISGDATASGESRKQARADFEASLLKTRAAVEQAARWLLEMALTMAATFSGQAGRFADLRAVVTCRVDTGPISADEQREARENVGAGLLSIEGGMERIGVDDVDAEQARIAAQRERELASGETA